jgi:glutathione-regulated potassium-efflux system ancillary protein KefG
MPDLLVLFAHPMLEKSRVHRVLVEVARAAPGVTLHDLYEEYPDFDVDIEREKELLLAHSTLVLQHPLYWYSCPALMKQWIDLVLEHGWAYGRQGKALAGKVMMNAISTGGNLHAYERTGLNRFSIREFLVPFEQTAALCNMTYLPPFVFHGTHRAAEDDIRVAARQYAEVLSALSRKSIDTGTLGQVRYINDLIAADKPQER